MDLKTLRTLGRSGLPVSPLCLGTMTFGNKAWGSADEVSAAIFNAYVDAGGNFLDTADVYAGGRSEELVGGYIRERGLRDKVVLATKFSFAGGNGRKNIHRAIEGSLRRLGTEYVDLYWMHVWDGVTPPEEMLQSMGDLVRAGKVRYFGLSDVPAWYVARMVTLAEAHGVPGPIAMQLEYSLVERTIEQEHVPMARALGLGVTPWSPLGFGFLSGKYTRAGDVGAGSGEGRLDGKTPMFQKFTDRNWPILDALRAVSAEAGRPMAEVALAWAVAQPGVTSVILGASKLEQLTSNLRSLDVALSAEQMDKLDKASAVEPVSPYAIFSAAIEGRVWRGHGGGLAVALTLTPNRGHSRALRSPNDLVVRQVIQ